MTVMKRKKSSARFGDHQQTGNNEASQKLHFGDHQRARVLRRFASCGATKQIAIIPYDHHVEVVGKLLT
jgi:hypothetical protein